MANGITALLGVGTYNVAVGAKARLPVGYEDCYNADMNVTSALQCLSVLINKSSSDRQKQL